MPTEKDLSTTGSLFWCMMPILHPDFPYWKYDRFDLDELRNDQCKADFRFYKNDIFKLAEYLPLPDEIVTYNGLVVGSIPALCIYLKSFTYPCRYGDMVSHFARPVPELCIITNHVIDWIYNRRHHLLSRYNHDLLSPANVMLYADAIYIDQAQLWKAAGGLLMEHCDQCVGQEKVREPFIMDIEEYIP